MAEITISIKFKVGYITCLKILSIIEVILTKIYGDRIEYAYLSFLNWFFSKTLWKYGVTIETS